MKYRSWLIVPGDSDKRLGMAVGTGADVIVVDLADTVAPDAREAARRQAADWLRAHRTNLLEQRRQGRWVRIEALEAGRSRDDLAAVMAGAPDGIVLPRSAGAEAVRQLAAEIYELEQRHGIAANSTRILPVAGETPLAAMRIADYLDSGHQRLAGLTWSAAGLAASLGTARLRDSGASAGAGGGRSDTARFVRAQVLLTAHAGRLMAIDAPCEDFADARIVTQAAREARADGFAGMFASHPDQIAAINAAFTPGQPEIEEARAIVGAFEASPYAGSLPLDGRMIDRADFAVAQRTLAAADADSAAEARRKPILRSA